MSTRHLILTDQCLQTIVITSFQHFRGLKKKEIMAAWSLVGENSVLYIYLYIIYVVVVAPSHSPKKKKEHILVCGQRANNITRTPSALRPLAKQIKLVPTFHCGRER